MKLTKEVKPSVAIATIEASGDIDEETKKFAIQAIMEKVYRAGTDTCSGCAYINVDIWDMPCVKCARTSKNFWKDAAKWDGNRSGNGTET